MLFSVLLAEHHDIGLARGSPITLPMDVAMRAIADMAANAWCASSAASDQRGALWACIGPGAPSSPTRLFLPQQSRAALAAERARRLAS